MNERVHRVDAAPCGLRPRLRAAFRALRPVLGSRRVESREVGRRFFDARLRAARPRRSPACLNCSTSARSTLLLWAALRVLPAARRAVDCDIGLGLGQLSLDRPALRLVRSSNCHFRHSRLWSLASIQIVAASITSDEMPKMTCIRSLVAPSFFCCGHREDRQSSAFSGQRTFSRVAGDAANVDSPLKSSKNTPESQSSISS